MSRVTEGPLAEGEDLAGGHLEDQGLAPAGMAERARADLVSPASVPLGRPGRGKPGQQRLVGDALGDALDDDVQAAVPRVAPGRKDYLAVGSEVDGLLLRRAGAEVEGAVEP